MRYRSVRLGNNRAMVNLVKDVKSIRRLMCDSGDLVVREIPGAGVAAVIIDVVINLAKNVCKTRRVLYIAMMCTAFVCTYLLGVSAMIIIFVCLGIGITDLLVSMRKEKKKCRCS